MGDRIEVSVVRNVYYDRRSVNRVVTLQILHLNMDSLLTDLVPSLDDIVVHMADITKLLDDKLFFLIHVDGNYLSLKGPFIHTLDDDGKTIANDVHLREKVQKEGYRCISHIWGVPDKPKKADKRKIHDDKYVWKTDNQDKKGSKYHHRIKNITWKVETRKEKRDKLLQIFNHYEGYFWMDNLCIDQSKDEKPINIMGDIYNKCKECICMLDYKWGTDEKKVADCNMDSPQILKERALLYLTTIFNCEWFTRVWTVQKWCLSRNVLYTKETSDELLLLPKDKLCSLPITVHGYDNDENQTKTKWMISMINDLSKPENLITHLITTKRMCKDPRDYYYGISGLLGITLHYHKTFDGVEKEFFARYERKKRNKTY
jgi:hypothetical protein